MASILQVKEIVVGEGTSATATFDSPTTAGSKIVTQFMLYEIDESGNISVTGVSGNNSETHSNNAASAGTAGSFFANVWLTRSFASGVISGRSGHQITITVSENAFIWGRIIEIGDAGAVDGGSFGTTTGTTVSGSGVTPTSAGIHLALAACLAGGGRTWTPGTGWTEQLDATDGSFWSQTLISRTAAASTSQTASATASSTVDASTITHIVIADAAAGGSTRGMPFGHEGTAFNGGRALTGILKRSIWLPQLRSRFA